MQRALQSAGLSGFGSEAIPANDLAESDYGDHEGRTTKDILSDNRDWYLFRDGCPGGETAADDRARADRVITRLRELDADFLIFSSAHILRVLAVRWLGLPAGDGSLFMLDTASISISAETI